MTILPSCGMNADHHAGAKILIQGGMRRDKRKGEGGSDGCGDLVAELPRLENALSFLLKHNLQESKSMMTIKIKN